MPSKFKVHLVEDDRTTLRLLENLSSMLGYETVSYSNGQEALSAFSKEQPSIVISDWMMPELDGLDLCRNLREQAQSTGSYTYFILVTAQRRSRSNLEQAIDAGVDDFLKKPISSEEIWNRLRVAERILSFNHQVQRLESLIPICCYCKKVRNDKDLWEQIEQYVNERTGADFTHSVCPGCIEKHFKPQLASYKKQLAEEKKKEASNSA
ncbi:response regulator [Puniceicoccaceae bacterium K14]|nr:response regulator [Puniceicoccaceae bacterium K14]